MHGRVQPNKCHVTDVCVHDHLSSLGYPMIIYTHPIVKNLPIKTLVARRLQTNTHTLTTYTNTLILVHIHTHSRTSYHILNLAIV